MPIEEECKVKGPLPWRQTMARRLFVWFAVVIVSTMVLSFTVSYLFWNLGIGSPWRQDVHRLQLYAADQIATRWEQPEQRKALLEDASVRFEKGFILRDHTGKVLERIGDFEHCKPHKFELEIKPYEAHKDAPPLGTLSVCHTSSPELTSIIRMVTTLAVIALLLWLASWMLSRALTKPLTELSDVARKIGDGDLSTRAKTSPNQGNELEGLGEAINDMAERIEQQIREQRQLLAAVSHELRTPIGHLHLLVGMASETGLGPKQIKELERELLEMEDLTEQLLATSRLNFELGDRKSIDMLELAIDSLERMGIDPTLLEASGDLDLGFVIEGDATLLGRALTNLLRNAQTHGEGLTTLSLRAMKEAVRIEVSDQGPGLPAEHLERLSSPFTQGSTTRSGSLGLGLFLARRIGHAHGGTLQAQPGEPEGVTLVLDLPRRGL